MGPFGLSSSIPAWFWSATTAFHVLGRVVSDAVTTLGSGVDGSVRRIEYAYDGQGNAYLVTSYDAASGGSIVNQVERAFNGLGQMTTEWQEHSGAVNTSTSTKVQYAYSEMPSGADHSRLTSITYPDGYVLTYNYSSGLNDSISRLSSLSDSTGTLEAYSYMGLATVVVRSHPQIDVDLTFVGTPGDAGDQYAGLDRFGRVVDQKWENTSTSTATDEFQYAYDVLGNRTSMTNAVNSAFDESYTYDDLNQLTGFSRGSHTQDFNYDAVGNFDSVTTDGGTAQTRSANAQNEITSISGATTPTYDANGNMTGDETGKQFVYDAWNRLVVVKDSGGSTLETFGYDGLNRRVTQSASSTTTDLYYSKDWQTLEEKVGSNYTQRYVWSPVYVDAMVLRDRDTNADGTLDERLWVQQDANWNVTALVNGSGSVVERYAYAPYGVRAVYDASWSSIGSSAYSMTYGFQGMYFDSIAGQNAADERWYTPTLERWTTVDPERFGAGDVNLDRFIGNGPTNGSDPSGLAEFTGAQAEARAKQYGLKKGELKAVGTRLVEYKQDGTLIETEFLPSRCPGEVVQLERPPAPKPSPTLTFSTLPSGVISGTSGVMPFAIIPQRNGSFTLLTPGGATNTRPPSTPPAPSALGGSLGNDDSVGGGFPNVTGGFPLAGGSGALSNDAGFGGGFFPGGGAQANGGTFFGGGGIPNTGAGVGGFRPPAGTGFGGGFGGTPNRPTGPDYVPQNYNWDGYPPIPQLDRFPTEEGRPLRPGETGYLPPFKLPIKP